MALYDVYGLGNALVDMEFEVTDSFLQQMKIEKGLMTLVNEARQREIIEAIHGMQHKRSCGARRQYGHRRISIGWTFLL